MFYNRGKVENDSLIINHPSSSIVEKLYLISTGDIVGETNQYLFIYYLLHDLIYTTYKTTTKKYRK